MKIKILLLTLALATLIAAPVRAAEGAPVDLGPRAAVAKALQCNLGLRYEQLSPTLSRALERKAGAVTDPILYGELNLKGVGDRFTPDARPTWSTSVEAAVGLKKQFFSGTSLDVSLSGNAGLSGGDPITGIGSDGGGSATISVRQPLLQGASPTVNRSGVTSARLDRQAAEATLQRKAEVLASTVLKAYWDLHAAHAQVRIQQVALKTAEKTLQETLDLIKVGRVPAADADSARLQVKVQERALLLAKQAVANQQDHLARLVGMVGPRSLATPEIQTRELTLLAVPTSLDTLQQTALSHRGDYRALKLKVRNAALDVTVAEDGTRPRLDLVGSLAVGASHDAQAAGSTQPATTGRTAFTVGLVFELPVGRQAARAQVDLAVLKRRQAEVAAAESEQAITEELKIAWRAVTSAERLVQLTRRSVAVAETKLNNEQARFRAGKTTAQLLTLVHADLIRERLAHERAAAEYQKALVDAWTASGALLTELRLAAK